MFGKKKSDFFVCDERLDHVAVIMDGNGRWAKARHLPRTEGHKAGAAAVEEILGTFRKIGVHTVTLFAFSTENWKRPREEVDAIMALLSSYLEEHVKPKMEEDDGFSVRFLGDLSKLPADLAAKCREVEELKKGRPFLVQVALNYGGRDEILRAARLAAADGVTPADADAFSRYLDTAGVRDPDLLIRTGGDMRISNFLLWQCAYTELYFTKTLFPDFGSDGVMDAVRDFYNRKRRFGGLDKEEKK